MFNRKLLKELDAWKTDKNRKPLILRGARQTGKTTLVEIFSRKFEHFVSLNLEHSRHRRFWQEGGSVEQILRSIEVVFGQKIVPGKTLLFLDEIQNEPRAIQSLRYFYETKPDLHVIASGSLMEVMLKKSGFSFPVGRVSFLYTYPLSFDEFLPALGRQELLEELSSASIEAPPSKTVHAFAEEQFREYVFLGGMPEVVEVYAGGKSYAPLPRIKESLLTSFEEDVPKYARRAQISHLNLLIHEAPLFAGQRIQYENFAQSGFRGREMKTAFETLEKAMIVQRVFGSPQVKMPAIPNLRVSPKLVYLDAGLVCHRLQCDPEKVKKTGLNDLFRGSLAEQVVGQGLLARCAARRTPPHFWYRRQPGSTAEVDFLVEIEGRLIPIEVKSGKAGKLRSLLQFMEQSPCPIAARIHTGELSLERIITPKQKEFRLLSVPFYLLFNLENLVKTAVV